MVLELCDISKSFGGVPALRGATLSVSAGEILGLVGENGAGKSTLINIASGVLQPDAGQIVLETQPVQVTGPRHAAALGIGVVHQEAELFSQLSVAENMLLARGLVRNRFGLIDWSSTYKEATRAIEAMGETMDVRRTAAGLSVARRTMSDIAAAVSERVKVLFLDEPTASLTLREIENLFMQIRRLRDLGVALVYVSHRLEEILELCDRVTIMRDGETVLTKPARELTMDSMVAAMVGRDVARMYARRTAPPGRVRLRVDSATADDGAFQDVSLQVRGGEVVGLYGFVGAGRSEFAQALFGLRPLKSGRVEIDGDTVKITSPRHAVRTGLAYVPEDRLVQGIFRSHALRSNASIAALRRMSFLGWIRTKKEKRLADQIIREMKVRARSMEQPIGTLSGGNQQKVVFGRWQATQPKVLMLDEPTRGVDVGAKAEIHGLVNQMAQQGAAVLLISSELPEVMGMSDRIVTLSEGRVTGEFNPIVDSEETIAAAAVPRSPDKAGTVGQTRPSSTGRLLKVREFGLMAFILLLAIGMTIYKPKEFANVQNFLDILTSAALPAIVAYGAMLIICAGGIDISVGAIMGLVGAIAALAANQGYHPALCLGLALVLGCVFSLANAATSLSARIHPIIVTLAGISIYRGIMRNVTGEREVTGLPDAYRAIAEGTLMGVPKLVWYVLALTVVTHVLLRYTLTGRRVLALGNSQTASRLIGLSKTRLTLFVFGYSGVLVGLASVLHPAYYGSVQANTGEGMELKAIAAAVIGGTNILGGRGSAIGTLLGAFLVAMLYNILILVQASPYWQQIFVGGLILFAVVLDALLQRMKGASG